MSRIKISIALTIPFFLLCSYYLNDDYGVQRVRFYLTIQNNWDGTLKIIQNPHWVATDYPSTKKILRYDILRSSFSAIS